MRFNYSVAVLAAAFSVLPNSWAQNISGQILTASGQPIVNAEIHLDQEKLHVKTDAQGMFFLSGLNKGVTELHVSARGYNHYNQKISVTEQSISGLSIVLAPTVMEIIDVHATPLHSSTIESALPVNVLSADELRLKQAATLGETLKNEVGVHSSYYGPVASSPIIRGLDGPRVLISQNGLDIGDASRVGGDHAVSTETSTATQIEVLRGPATLFYGSGAIGGVVNVVDERIPTSVDNSIEWLVQHNDVADQDEASVNVNTGSEDLAIHFDGFWRVSNDYDIPGDAELHTESHIGDADHEHDEDEHDHQEEKGTLANSYIKAEGYTVGISQLFDNGYIGGSFGHLSREYGLPGHGHGEEHEEEGDDHQNEQPVYAKLKQDRVQVISDFNFDDDIFSRLATKFAYTDYQHQEIENGEVGTTFKNKSTELRADIYHQEWQGWNGAWTIHYKSSDFKAIGEEAFTPPTKTSAVAIGWLEEKHFGNWLVQSGVRIEGVEITVDGLSHDEHEADHDHTANDDFKKQEFLPVSASLGFVWDYKQGYNLGLSASFSQRAPSASELFANGPHIGTNTFEVGAIYTVEQEGDEIHTEIGKQNPSLESSYNLDITWRKFEGDFGFVASAFYNRIKDYYYQQDTGFMTEGAHNHSEEESSHDDGAEHDEEHLLPVFVYRQDDVNLYGLEAELVYQVNDPLTVRVFTDFTRAKLADGGNLPRIPARRIGSQLNYQAEQFSAELSFTHHFKQNDIGIRETTTASYNMLDAHINYYLSGIGDDLVVYVKGHNLTNEDARVHSSFLKNQAPLPARGFTIGVRGSF